MYSRGLLKSMITIGSAQSVKILFSIVRMKAVAVLLGPSGVGLLSIYNNLQGMVQQTAGLGLKSSGVREIATSREDEVTLSRVRRVLFAAHLVQGTLAMLAVWLFRTPIATWLFGDPMRATEVGLIGVAILLGLLGAAQTALLQGLRRIVDLSRITVIGAFAGTAAGLIAVWVQGEAGLIWFILVQPLAAVLVALHYTKRLAKPTAATLPLVEIWKVWKPMAKLGFAFMLGELATLATLLLIRGQISNQIGLDAAGYFAAAWGISMTYVGFMLGAMAVDYYPRLTEVISDNKAAVRLMNEQAQLGLAIGGPVLLLLIGLAPWVITLLFSKEFDSAAIMVQWQTVGNIFKLASWALGFAIIATGSSKTFLAVQLSFNLIFISFLWPTLEPYGIEMVGPAYTLAYVIHFALLYFIVRHKHGFRWERLTYCLLSVHVILALMLLMTTYIYPIVTAIISICLAVATAVWGLRIIIERIDSNGELKAKIMAILSKFGI